MGSSEHIVARLTDRLAERGWSVMPSDSEGEWSVSVAGSNDEVVLVLQQMPVQTYLTALIVGHLPHEIVDGVGTGAIQEEVVTDAADRLHALLSAQGPGVLTEVGIRTAGTGAETYFVRALRAAPAEPEPGHLPVDSPGKQLARPDATA